MANGRATNSEIYAKLESLQSDIHSLRILVEQNYGETKVHIERLNSVNERVAMETVKSDKATADLDKRIDILEAADKRWTAFAVFLSGIVSAVVSSIVGSNR